MRQRRPWQTSLWSKEASCASLSATERTDGSPFRTPPGYRRMVAPLTPHLPGDCAAPLRVAWRTAGKAGPVRTDWIHEMKHDGYRIMVIRENECVRLLSKNGSDWPRRYPWIAEAACKIRRSGLS